MKNVYSVIGLVGFTILAFGSSDVQLVTPFPWRTGRAASVSELLQPVKENSPGSKWIAQEPFPCLDLVIEKGAARTRRTHSTSCNSFIIVK